MNCSQTRLSWLEVGGRRACPLLPTAARPSGGLRGSCPGLVISPPYPVSRAGRPTDQDAPIGKAGLERIGPPAGDLGPVTACPAGPSPATRAEGGEGAAHKDRSRAGKVGAARQRVALMTATVTATAAANGYQQRPATAHNARTIRTNLAYARPETDGLSWATHAAALAGPWVLGFGTKGPPADAVLTTVVSN